MPENSIPGFLKAIDLGVTTLEMDLSFTADSILVLSHEPYFSSEICEDTVGNRISERSRGNLYQMRYDEIVKYDCGSLPHPRFPDQMKIQVFKPRFTDVLDTVDWYVTANSISPVHFNIELKTRVETDHVFHPAIGVFSNLVFEELARRKILDRVTIQSFDFRTLQYFKKKYPEVELAVLIENELPWKHNLDSLGFIPDIYSCYYQLLSRESIAEMQADKIRVIPWTVNETETMVELIAWGVDGIITDYPDRLINLLSTDK